MQPEHGAGHELYHWPQALPGGAVLFNTSNGSSWDQARIEVFSQKTGERRVLLEGGTCPYYVAPGYIVFQRDAQLMAVPFDPKSLKITGPPEPTLVHLRTDPSTGAAQFTISNNGTLAYVPGSAVAPESKLVWVDRKGNETPISSPPQAYGLARLSPDGTRVAFMTGDPTADIEVYDLVRGTLSQLTSSGNCRRPVWSPDGQKIAYTSGRGNGFKVFLINVDGSGEEQLTAGGGGIPYSFSPDGRLLGYYGSGPHAGDPHGIWILPLTGNRKPQFFRPGNEPDFSPDGRWIAYSLCERDPCQLYVAPYPGPGEQQQVSVHGAWDSRWSPDGRELLWGGDGGVIAVSVTRAGSALKLGKPRLLFKTQDGFTDVSPDGKRFLMVQDLPTTPATQINVVLNWAQNLARAASTSVKP
jgi:eukaryotic-like serine/threonine-protein kinase